MHKLRPSIIRNAAFEIVDVTEHNQRLSLFRGRFIRRDPEDGCLRLPLLSFNAFEIRVSQC